MLLLQFWFHHNSSPIFSWLYVVLMKAKKASFLILTTSCLFYCFVLLLLWISGMNVWLFRELFKGRRISEKLHKILYIVIFALLTWLCLVPFGLRNAILVHAFVCFFNIFSGNNMNDETASMKGCVVCWWKKTPIEYLYSKNRKYSYFLSSDHNPWQRWAIHLLLGKLAYV